MSAIFPSAEWLKGVEVKLNTDERYAEVAKNWEGDLFIRIEPEGNLKEGFSVYFDLWHGKCRIAEYKPDASAYPKPVFVLSATYNNIVAILTGKLSPMTAMMTMKLKVQGNMGYMMRNVPTVLDFVRVLSEATEEIM
jgi:putative sterol carrier protein